jgi:hypothetical protein
MRKIWMRFSDQWWKNVTSLGGFTWNVPILKTAISRVRVRLIYGLLSRNPGCEQFHIPVPGISINFRYFD